MISQERWSELLRPGLRSYIDVISGVDTESDYAKDVIAGIKRWSRFDRRMWRELSYRIWQIRYKFREFFGLPLYFEQYKFIKFIHRQFYKLFPRDKK